MLRINRRPRHRSADYVWPPRTSTASGIPQPYHPPPPTRANQKTNQREMAATGCKKSNNDGKTSTRLASSTIRGNKISNSFDNINNIAVEPDQTSSSVAVVTTTVSPPPPPSPPKIQVASIEMEINSEEFERRHDGSVSPIPGEKRVCTGTIHLWPPPPPPLETATLSISPVSMKKGFYLPEEKIHSGEVDEIKHVFEGMRWCFFFQNVIKNGRSSEEYSGFLTESVFFCFISIQRNFQI